jgi:hypothetical protein
MSSKGSRAPQPNIPHPQMYADEPPQPTMDKRLGQFKKTRRPGDSTVWHHNDGTAQWQAFQNDISLDLGRSLGKLELGQSTLNDAVANHTESNVKAVFSQLKISKKTLDKADKTAKIPDIERFLQQLNDEYDELEAMDPGSNCAREYREAANTARRQAMDLLYRLLGKMKDDQLLALEAENDELKAENARLHQEKVATDDLLFQAANHVKVSAIPDTGEAASMFVDAFSNALVSANVHIRELLEESADQKRDLFAKINDLQTDNSSLKDSIVQKLKTDLQDALDEKKAVRDELEQEKRSKAELLQSNYQVKLDLASASYKLGALEQFQQRAQQEIDTTSTAMRIADKQTATSDLQTTILGLQTTIAQMQDNHGNEMREEGRRCNVAICCIQRRLVLLLNERIVVLEGAVEQLEREVERLKKNLLEWERQFS